MKKVKTPWEAAQAIEAILRRVVSTAEVSVVTEPGEESHIVAVSCSGDAESLHIKVLMSMVPFAELLRQEQAQGRHIFIYRVCF